MVLQILCRRQYLGLNVWAKRALNLNGRSSLRPCDLWVTSKAPFKPIVDEATFEKAADVLASHRPQYTSEVLIRRLKLLMNRKGKLSYAIVDRSGPAASTYLKRFGSLLAAYEQAGFKQSPSRYAMSEHYRDHRTMYNSVVGRLHELFPYDVRVLRAAREQKGCLEVDGKYQVSVFICGQPKRTGREGRRPWLLRLPQRERQNIALICMLDSQWKQIVGYHLLHPPGDSIRASHRFYEDDPWLIRSGRRLRDDLGDFCTALRTLSRCHTFRQSGV